MSPWGTKWVYWPRIGSLMHFFRIRNEIVDIKKRKMKWYGLPRETISLQIFLKAVFQYFTWSIFEYFDPFNPSLNLIYLDALNGKNQLTDISLLRKYFLKTDSKWLLPIVTHLNHCERPFFPLCWLIKGVSSWKLDIIYSLFFRKVPS